MTKKQHVHMKVVPQLCFEDILNDCQRSLWILWFGPLIGLFDPVKQHCSWWEAEWSMNIRLQLAAESSKTELPGKQMIRVLQLLVVILKFSAVNNPNNFDLLIIALFMFRRRGCYWEVGKQRIWKTRIWHFLQHMQRYWNVLFQLLILKWVNRSN